MQYYQIENWDTNFETPESRKIKNLKWVAIQNSFDGKIYKRLLKHPEPARVFGVAVLMAELASRAPKEHRGKLAGSDLSTGYSIEDMANKTGMPEDDFYFAIPILIDIGWISFFDDSRKLSGIPDKNPLHYRTGQDSTGQPKKDVSPSGDQPLSLTFWNKVFNNNKTLLDYLNHMPGLKKYDAEFEAVIDICKKYQFKPFSDQHREYYFKTINKYLKGGYTALAILAVLEDIAKTPPGDIQNERDYYGYFGFALKNTDIQERGWERYKSLMNGAPQRTGDILKSIGGADAK